MIDGLFQPKATMDELSDLHNKVAKAISRQLDDPKVLALAVKFLKDNNVVTDMIVSSDFISLTDNIKAIAERESNKILTDDLIDELEDF